MPYRLQISKEEVEAELRKMGYTDFPEELVETFRRDLLKLIKNDLRKLRKLKEQEAAFPHTFPGHLQPCTSTPSSEAELETDKISQSPESATSEYGSYSSKTASEVMSDGATSVTSDYSSVKTSDEAQKSEREQDALVCVRKKEKQRQQTAVKDELPSYPERPDPVNLYHYYKAHWDKYKIPGEDPRNELRWEIRSKLFHSN